MVCRVRQGVPIPFFFFFSCTNSRQIPQKSDWQGQRGGLELWNLGLLNVCHSLATEHKSMPTAENKDLSQKCNVGTKQSQLNKLVMPHITLETVGLPNNL